MVWTETIIELKVDHGASGADLSSRTGEELLAYIRCCTIQPIDEAPKSGWPCEIRLAYGFTAKTPLSDVLTSLFKARVSGSDWLRWMRPVVSGRLLYGYALSVTLFIVSDYVPKSRGRCCRVLQYAVRVVADSLRKNVSGAHWGHSMDSCSLFPSHQWLHAVNTIVQVDRSSPATGVHIFRPRKS